MDSWDSFRNEVGDISASRVFSECSFRALGVEVVYCSRA